MPLVVVVGAIMAGSLWPFRPAVGWPHKVRNQLERRADGSLRFAATSVARTLAAPAWLPRVIGGAAFAVEVEARTTDTDQEGPARLFTLSPNPYERNLMIGQEGADLLVRVRRPGSDWNGEPPLVVPGVFANDEWHRCTLSIANGELLLAVDGVERTRTPFGERARRRWSSDYRVGLGDELTLDRPWEGELRRALVVVDGEEFDYTAPAAIDEPREVWLFPEASRFLLRPDPRGARTVFAHLLAFVAFGAAYALAARRGERSVLRLACWATLLGLGKELAKILVEGRHATLLHVPVEVLGALIGGGAVLFVLRRRAHVERQRTIARAGRTPSPPSALAGPE
ncbi:MAG: LamG domain-containing protein [bacterium]|nr:LamG domain-containing protein [bacterium]